jgi:hypothetical protein
VDEFDVELVLFRYDEAHSCARIALDEVVVRLVPKRKQLIRGRRRLCRYGHIP